MSELDRTAWAKEVQRAEKAVAHRRTKIREFQDQVDELEAKIDTLLKKITDDYNDENED